MTLVSLSGGGRAPGKQRFGNIVYADQSEDGENCGRCSNPLIGGIKPLVHRMKSTGQTATSHDNGRDADRHRQICVRARASQDGPLSSSRKTHSSGISGSTSNSCAAPLTSIMVTTPLLVSTVGSTLFEPH